MRTQFYLGILKERDYLEHLGVDSRTTRNGYSGSRI
jgi:hypothetical protein